MTDATTATQLRLVCGLLASASRLVPVPFLDDVLRGKALQLLVSRTLRAHGRTYGSARVAPLYGDEGGCLSGCLLFLVLLPIKLILYPVRKILAWVMAVKHLARDLSEAVLLGRTLERCLSAGRLAQASGAEDLRAEAARIRMAFASALAGTDLRLMRGTLTTALRSVSGLPRAALHALRRLRGKGDEADPTAGLSSADKRKVEEGAARVSAALETAEMRAFLERFDATFDENLRILEERGAAPRA
ncbi:MAG: hypothetical protein M5U28_37715 [Sandaracinaceae bacterium]|nr:hypothetical protein [Sandaracinaceae bacterium]